MPVVYRRTTVHRKNIITMVQVGDGARWTRGEAKEVERFARMYSPARTGFLRDSHVTLPTRGSNAYEKKYRITAQARYSAFVALGTGVHGPLRRPIRSDKGMGPIPGHGGRRPKYIWHSKGQRPNDWLERAAASVAAKL